MKDYIVIFITTSNKEEAEEIAQSLVEKRLAACVNIIPDISSIYAWKGKIEKSKELLLIVKTRSNLWNKLTKKVKKNHSYDTPEIIALPIVKGLKTYLDWIDQSLV